MTDDEVALERYKAHAIVVAGSGAARTCCGIIVDVNDCASDIERTEVPMSGVAGSSSVDAAKLALAAYPVQDMYVDGIWCEHDVGVSMDKLVWGPDQAGVADVARNVMDQCIGENNYGRGARVVYPCKDGGPVFGGVKWDIM